MDITQVQLDIEPTSTSEGMRADIWNMGGAQDEALTEEWFGVLKGISFKNK